MRHQALLASRPSPSTPAVKAVSLRKRHPTRYGKAFGIFNINLFGMLFQKILPGLSLA
jgi:hypothetical protein